MKPWRAYGSLKVTFEGSVSTVLMCKRLMWFKNRDTGQVACYFSATEADVRDDRMASRSQ